MSKEPKDNGICCAGRESRVVEEMCVKCLNEYMTECERTMIGETLIHEVHRIAHELGKQLQKREKEQGVIAYIKVPREAIASNIVDLLKTRRN